MTTALRRVIGPGTLAITAMNLSIGSGIFALPAVAATVIGPRAVYAYLVCGAALSLVLLCFAELGSTTTRSGGAYAYITRAFGPFWGFLSGVLLWFGFGVLSDAAIAAAMADTLAGLFPVLATPAARTLVIVGLLTMAVVVNVRGARSGARMAVLLTLIKLAPLAVLVLASLPHWSVPAITGGGLPTSHDLGAASLLLFFAFSGAEASLSNGAEILDVGRTVPRGIMLGCAGIVLVYLSVHVAAQSILGSSLATAGGAPLATAAAVVLGPAGRTLLLVGAAMSMAATVSGDLLATPRALFATAEDGHLPAVLARVHPRFATPWVAIVTYGVMTGTTAILGGFALLAALASAGLLLVYFGVCLAVLRERVRQAQAAEFASGASTGYRIPGGPVVPVAGMVLVLGLLANAKAEEWAPLGGLVGVSSLYYVLRQWRLRVMRHEPHA